MSSLIRSRATHLTPFRPICSGSESIAQLLEGKSSDPCLTSRKFHPCKPLCSRHPWIACSGPPASGLDPIQGRVRVEFGISQSWDLHLRFSILGLAEWDLKDKSMDICRVKRAAGALFGQGETGPGDIGFMVAWSLTTVLR